MDLLSPNDQLVSLVTSFFGVPGYILSTFAPTLQQFATKQPRLFKAMILLVALSTFGMSLLDRIKRTVLSFLVSNFMFSTTIDSVDPLYNYTMRWMKAKSKLLPEQELQARSKGEVDRNVLVSMSGLPLAPLKERDEKSPEVVYEFNGLQIFWHKWWPYFVTQYPHGKIRYPQFLIIRSFGMSSQSLRDILDEAYNTFRKSDQAHLTAVYRPVARSGGWKCVARRNRRSLDTIVLDPIEKESILEDIKFYLSTEAKGWYNQRGIPYRRGYLFHGRPGTGKTSLSMAIAGHFALDVYIISLLDPYINDTFLHTFFTNLPKGALILLEDIDSAGLAREAFDQSLQAYRLPKSGSRKSHTRTKTRVTLSGLLNAIDGADSPEGHLLIMTTNAPDALDEALIRPGRIDYKVGFKATSPAQAETMFIRMYRGDIEDESDLDDLAVDFGKKIMDDTFTPAELQGHLLRYKKHPKAALENLVEWMDGVLQERKAIEDARQAAEKRAELKEKKRKAKKKARRNDPIPLAGSDPTSDSDSSEESDKIVDAIDLPPIDEFGGHGYLEANPAYADHNVDNVNIVRPPPSTRMLEMMMPPTRDRRRHRSRDITSWDEINGKERTCGVM